VKAKSYSMKLNWHGGPDLGPDSTDMRPQGNSQQQRLTPWLSPLLRCARAAEWTRMKHRHSAGWADYAAREAMPDLLERTAACEVLVGKQARTQLMQPASLRLGLPASELAQRGQSLENPCLATCPWKMLSASW
jgi:hypothetical protein